VQCGDAPPDKNLGNKKHTRTMDASVVKQQLLPIQNSVVLLFNYGGIHGSGMFFISKVLIWRGKI
jgi:hypothetical protein